MENMNRQKAYLIISCLFASSIAFSQIHQTISATGGNASGAGGSSISYTAGQIAYSLKGISDWTIAEGVQQPYEISTLRTTIENGEDITLKYEVFPNPARGFFKLTVNPFNDENIRFRLYDNKGLVLMDKKVESGETVITIDALLSTIYFLKVFRDDKEVKVFKIVKI